MWSKICQQCVIKLLSACHCSPWTQLSSIFTVWGLAGLKLGLFQQLLILVPIYQYWSSTSNLYHEMMHGFKTFCHIFCCSSHMAELLAKTGGILCCHDGIRLSEGASVLVNTVTQEPIVTETSYFTTFVRLWIYWMVSNICWIVFNMTFWIQSNGLL